MASIEEARLLWDIISVIVTLTMTALSVYFANRARIAASKATVRNTMILKVSGIQDQISRARECLLDARRAPAADEARIRESCRRYGQDLIDQHVFCGSCADEVNDIGSLLLDTQMVLSENGAAQFLFRSGLVKDHLQEYLKRLIEK